MTLDNRPKATRKKKIAGLVLILLLPSIFYVVLSKANHHYRALPFIGPKVVLNGDTSHHKIPPFKLLDQNGKYFSNQDLRGKIVVANFFFTRCPSICPKMAAHLLDFQNKFEGVDSLIIISHTVDPLNDDVAALKKYAEKVHAQDGRWYFLTGDKEKIYQLAFSGYFASAQKDEAAPGGFLHSELVFLIDGQGRLRGSYDDQGNIVPAFDGTSTSEMKKMADAVDNLLLEKYAPKKKR
ncbi:MAG: SCO family protein [Vicingaceae bacterium]